jgi:hypothetical protein
LVGKLERKEKRLGRPEGKRENNIKMDLSEINLGYGLDSGG